jgi:hypothetical protein
MTTSIANPPRRGRGKASKSLALIDAARGILKAIQPASVRAVSYQLFVLGIIASMKKSETNRVSTQLTWAREAGIIPWDWIVDETREAEHVNAWKDTDAFVRSAFRQYRRDRWADQPERLEIWSEKGTIRGVLAPILDEYGVTFRVFHGYNSATVMYDVSRESRQSEKPWTAFYCGDWDPSGLHMSVVDLPSRLQEYGGRVQLQRLALDRTDLTDELPWFSAETKRGTTEKKGDSRYPWFMRYVNGDHRCWELDALNPVILRHRVEQAIRARLDLDAWRRADVVEAAEKESLTTILNAWPGISRQAPKYQDGGTR